MTEPQGFTGPPIRHIDPPELAARMADGTAPRIIDVREPREWQIAHIEGSELMPLGQIQGWWPDLASDEEIVFVCHTGTRSGMVCRALAAKGFNRLINLSGGIDAWSREVDPTVPRY